MIKKYSVFICIIMSVAMLMIAMILYPGGSILDQDSIGFDWTKNFVSNLFAKKAINGAENPGRIWALVGMAFHSVGYGIFFINTSKKIPHKHSSNVLISVGWLNMLFSFLVATSLHDIMVAISSTLSMLGLFYITVFVFRTKLHLLKFCCVICMLTFYYTLYLYGAGNWGLLAIMQKVSFIASMLLVLAIEYFTNSDDFNLVKKSEKNYNPGVIKNP